MYMCTWAPCARSLWKESISLSLRRLRQSELWSEVKMGRVPWTGPCAQGQEAAVGHFWKRPTSHSRDSRGNSSSVIRETCGFLLACFKVVKVHFIILWIDKTCNLFSLTCFKVYHVRCEDIKHFFIRLQPHLWLWRIGVFVKKIVSFVTYIYLD
jgi:hypothetical protein